MIIEQLMPALSPTMEEGTIASWNVSKGDKVSAGQVIAEVQTDKTTVEWEALDDGYVAEILIPAGEEAKVNMVAALLSSEQGEDASEAIEEAKQKNAELTQGSGADDAEASSEAASESDESDEAGQTKQGGQAAPRAAGNGAHAAPPSLGERPQISQQVPVAVATSAPPAARKLQPGNGRVSPVAARLAAEHNVPLGELHGSGPDGRVVKRDIERYLSGDVQAGAGAARQGNPFLHGGGPEYQDQPLSQMRAIIGRRLQESKQQIPHYYVSERCDVRRLVALRTELNGIEGVKVSFNDLLIKASALTLLRHPAVNSTFDGQTIRNWRSADIAMAVAIPDGLITPIIRSSEQLTVSQINAIAKDLAQRAQAGKLQQDEYQGGSFTISNLGMFGIEQFDAVINPPHAAILAVGGIKDEALVDDGQVVAGQTMRLTLSADHRVIDGAVAAAFMRDLREMLEHPGSLML